MCFAPCITQSRRFWSEKLGIKNISIADIICNIISVFSVPISKPGFSTRILVTSGSEVASCNCFSGDVVGVSIRRESLYKYLFLVNFLTNDQDLL